MFSRISTGLPKKVSLEFSCLSVIDLPQISCSEYYSMQISFFNTPNQRFRTASYYVSDPETIWNRSQDRSGRWWSCAGSFCGLLAEIRVSYELTPFSWNPFQSVLPTNTYKSDWNHNRITSNPIAPLHVSPLFSQYTGSREHQTDWNSDQTASQTLCQQAFIKLRALISVSFMIHTSLDWLKATATFIPNFAGSYSRHLFSVTFWSLQYTNWRKTIPILTARRTAPAAGDRPQADSTACSQKSGCPMNSQLRCSNSIGHLLISLLASPESPLLQSRRPSPLSGWFWLNDAIHLTNQYMEKFSPS